MIKSYDLIKRERGNKIMKKTILLVFTALLVVTASFAYAYNYKFHFDMNTGYFGIPAYTEYAYKVTTNESAVIKVDYIQSAVRTGFVVVNSNGEERTDHYITNSPGSYLFKNYGMQQNYKYRVKAWTINGSDFVRYNLTGYWNRDEY